ncbi:hypothetical protein [Litchfieldia alkalitelluris]|uniref:hypothetical protein n=1 Tax=Litchfieldia alkalitelluris TaxID=304268 RepID=UPI000997F125|nr:hypothetical protein [Litchfieldia alkalitelluris]
MTVIQIGSFAMLTKWFNLGISIFLSLILIWFWLTFYKKDLRKVIFDIISGNVILGLFIWKASLTIFEPKLIIDSPLSLLYFTGGSKGLVIAILFVYIITFFQLRKKVISISEILFIAITCSFATVGLYNVMSGLLLIVNNLYHLLLGFTALFILGWLLLRWRTISIKNIFTTLIIFSFYQMIIALMTGRGFLIIENGFSIGVIIVSLFLWDRDDEME